MLTTIEASAENRKSAKTPHELFTINMVIVSLFFVVLVSMVLDSGSMFNVGRGEIDQVFMQDHPQ